MPREWETSTVYSTKTVEYDENTESDRRIYVDL